MIGIIDNYNFKEMPPQKYWAPPSSWSDEKKKETTQSRIFSGEWWGATKMDGYFSKLVKDEDGNIGLYSRSRNVNGEYPEKHEWVPHLQPFFDWLPNGTCLLGELYLPSKPGSSNITSLLGCLKDKCVARQAAGEKLCFYAFDILAIDGKSLMNYELTKRLVCLDDLFIEYGELGSAAPAAGYVKFARYVSGKELWRTLQEVFASGGEGMVITRGGAKYQPDKRPSKDCQKVKKELADNIDCFFTGRAAAPTREYTGKEIETWKYWEDIRTGAKMEGEHFKEYSTGAMIEPVTKPYFHRWAGSLEIGVMKDGKVEPIGFLSGLTDEIKANFKDYANRCIEVAAMEVLPETLALRHGKFMKFRDDLTPADCTWEKAFG